MGYYDFMPKWSKAFAPPFGLYNYAYYFGHPHVYLHHVFLEIKYFVQRGRRGYSDRDLWSWGSYVATINSAALQYLAFSSMGYPISLTAEEWRNRLLKMADGFQALLEIEAFFGRDRSQEEQKKVYSLYTRRMREGLALYTKHIMDLWD